MADNPQDTLVAAREVVRLIGFYQQDNDHVLHRRFQRLHLYNLYSKHNCLVELDKELGSLENAIKPQTDGTPHPEAFEQAPKLDAGLFVRIDDALKDFDAASLLYHRSLKAPDPPHHLVDGLRSVTEKSLPQYFSQYDEEGAWLDCAWHTATEKGLIHQFVDRHNSLRQLFKQDDKSKRSLAMIYSEAAVRRLEIILINIIFCLAILLPIFVLSFLGSKVGKLILVLGFVIIAAAVTSFVATSVQKNSFAVLAAYTAVLVVFLGTASGN